MICYFCGKDKDNGKVIIDVYICTDCLDGYVEDLISEGRHIEPIEPIPAINPQTN